MQDDHQYRRRPTSTIEELETEVMAELGITEEDLEEQRRQRKEEDSIGCLALGQSITTESIH